MLLSACSTRVMWLAELKEFQGNLAGAHTDMWLPRNRNVSVVVKKRPTALVMLPVVLCAVRAAVDYSAVGAALETPTTYSSADGELTLDLRLQEFRYTSPSGSSFYGRAFNGELPGPVIRVKAGDTLNINLYNDLGEEPTDTSGDHNQFRQPNHTNIHTHGLHVSSEAPADDIFTLLAPGESYSYTYQIPSWHMGGSHWYHPHHHGSTALQAGGGAVGFLLVEDADGEVPWELSTLEEIVMIMTRLNTEDLSTVEQASGGDLHVLTGSHVDQVLVNGQWQPVVSVRTGRWYRLRIVFAAIDGTATFSLSDCDLRLLAKDGVYLPSAPREVTSLPLFPGARCDVLVRCPQEGSVDFGASGGGGGAWTGTAATFSVTGLDEGAAEFPTFAVNRPCYLVDLQGSTASSELAANGASLAVTFGGVPNINGEAYEDETTYITSLAPGTVHEWTIAGANRHPVHLHINPFQIVAVPQTSDYFQLGDWCAPAAAVIQGMALLSIISHMGYTPNA